MLASTGCIRFHHFRNGGGVIPTFTNNGVPGAAASKNNHLEKLALGSILLVLAADLFSLTGSMLVALLALAAFVHALRLLRWNSWRTLRTPLVWVLHAAYGFIVLHLLLRTLAEAGFVASSAATHALTAGGIGTMTIGMMTRTARGHTARPLRADWVDTLAYFSVILSALVRVLVPLWFPQWIVSAVLASAVLWASGFSLYAIRYAPFLIRPRLDGKPG